MAYEEKVAYETMNVAYKSKRGIFLVLTFPKKNGQNLKSAYGLRYPSLIWPCDDLFVCNYNTTHV